MGTTLDVPLKNFIQPQAICNFAKFLGSLWHAI